MAYSYDYVRQYNEIFEQQHSVEIERLSASERKALVHVMYGADYLFNANSKSYVEIEPGSISSLSEFTRKSYGNVVDILVPEEFREDFYCACDSFNKYQFSRTSYRRSYRCKDYAPFAQRIFELMYNYYLLGYLELHIGGMKPFVADEIENDVKRCVYLSMRYKDNIIASRIDSGDSEVIELVEDMMVSENNTNILSYTVIRSVIMSENSELHELLCKLLVAARLSEGLRQAICECADCGTSEAFIMLLKTIRDNNLIRFPSVKRAVGTWTGICREGDPDRMAGKVLDDIIYVLESRSNCLEYINTTDAVHIYCGLWGLSFYDMFDALEVIKQLVGVRNESKGERAARILLSALKGKIKPEEDGSSQNDNMSNPNMIQLMTIGYFCADVEIVTVTRKIAAAVLEAYPEDYKLFSLFLTSYVYYDSGYRYNGKLTAIAMRSNRDMYNNREFAEKHYEILRNMYCLMPKKSLVYEQILFPWFSSEISKSQILRCMLAAACVLDNDEKLEFLGEHITDFDTYRRSDVISKIGERMRTQKQRDIVINAVADKERSTRSEAVKVLENKKLSENEYVKLEGFARYKTANLRNGVISLLKKRTPDGLKTSVSRMLKSDDENIRLAALDILLYAVSEYKDEDFSYEINAASAASTSDREQILIDELRGADSKGELSEKNGYGLYDPDAVIPLSNMKPDTNIVSDFFSVTSEELTEMQLALMKLIDDNAELSYKDYSGEERLLGSFGHLPYRWSDKAEIRAKQRLYEVIPFHELWAQYYKTSVRTPSRFWSLYFQSAMSSKPAEFDNDALIKYERNQSLLFGAISSYEPEAKLYSRDERFKNREFISLRGTILECIASEFDLKIPLDVLQNCALYVAREMSDDELLLKRYRQGENPYYWQNNPYNYLTSTPVRDMTLQLSNRIYEDHERNFRILHELNLKSKRLAEILEKNNTSQYHSFNEKMSAREYVFAYAGGMITADNVYKIFFEVFGLRSVFSVLGRLINQKYSVYAVADRKMINGLLSNEGKQLDEEGMLPKDSRLYLAVEKFLSEITDLVLNVELKRGDSETIFSGTIPYIEKIYGMDRLMEILKALGNETFRSGRYYYRGITKSESLSHLLSVCYPVEGDSFEKLTEYRKSIKLSDDRLIEVAMFAPQWIDIIEGSLGIQGLKCACYYFMAHTAEFISDKKLAIIAKYTPLTKEELNGGCFDVKWFREAYEIMGEKLFNKVYKSAKYISSGNMHTRARKFADAALGKYDIHETMEKIADKRNKDLLLSLAIIPSVGRADILERYEFIQKFLKESKKFGAQRRASEGAAVQYALKNLAKTAGYSDETRLTLSMETELVRANSGFFDKNEIEGYSVWIEVGIEGKASLRFEKGGKALKSTPAAIKKNERFLQIKEFYDKLRQQYSRTVKMFEAAMEDSETFTFGELSMLGENPVTKAITEALVFVNEENGFISGFMCSGGLSDENGEIHAMNGEAHLRVAHPFDMYSHRIWTQYQQRVLEMGEQNGRKQPFRQIFRELYVKLPEELDKYYSRMFAGNQIQPKRTLGALRTRRWVADYEDGLQKIYYKDDIIAEIYAVADWFSPSDIEAPMLEEVSFSDRKNYSQLKISEVPDIIYSEVMRDVDLAVSVAHAGGVDPETSHSTIEMRRVIAEFNLKLFGINNVKFEKNHAVIDGKWGRYTIHLGSGVIHKMGGHQINVVAVSSGKKSKIFLPFIDEDPKTAEIMSKIITFAQDNKIKDPFIMEQIKEI